MNRLRLFINKLKNWITSFPISFMFGILIGILLVLFFTKWNTFLAGVVLGLILEQLLLGVKDVIKEWNNTRPLNKLLGTICDNEDCYIYFSSFYRNLKKPEEYKLLRWEKQGDKDDVFMTGPAFVLGEGDALALALIKSLLAKTRKKPEQIIVERAEKEIDKWGRSCFCIGAHNPKTRIILKKFKNLFFYFDNNYGVITKSGSKKRITDKQGNNYRMGVFIETDKETEPTDYGLILKIKDQFHNTNKTMFVIAGIGPAGTSGAAYYLLTNFKDLSEMGEEFGLLIQVPSGYQSARKVDFDKVANYYVPNNINQR